MTQLPRLLGLLASQVTTLVNYSNLSGQSGIAQSTLKRYMTLLQTTFLIQMVPAWTSNLNKRLVKSPKLLFIDTGLGTHLTGTTETRMDTEPTLTGYWLEAFVGTELLKQITWSETLPSLFHFRTQNKSEVDFVLEDAAGHLVGIEVKATSSINTKAFNGLKALRDMKPARFRRGIVLYTGTQVVPFEQDLYAVPMPALWEW